MKSLMIAIAVCVCLPAAAKAEITLRFSRWLPPTDFVNVDVFEPWAADVARVTEGRVRIEFTAASLAPPPRQWQILLDGITDIGWHSHSYTPGEFPIAEGAELPFLGDSAEAISVAYLRTHLHYFAKAQEHMGAVVLNVHAAPPGHIYNVKHPIRTMDDFRGLKIRTTNKIVTEALQTFGATPVIGTAPQLYENLSRGVMDGTTLTDYGVVMFRVDKFIKYALHIPGGLYNQTFVLGVNPEKWNRISEADRAAIMRVSGEPLSVRWGRRWDEKTKEGYEQLKKAGVQFTTASGAFLEEIKSKVAHFEMDWVKKANAKGLDGRAALEFMRSEVANYQPQR